MSPRVRGQLMNLHCIINKNPGEDIGHKFNILGHANVKTTQIYAKIVDDNKKKAVNLIPKL